MRCANSDAVDSASHEEHLVECCTLLCLLYDRPLVNAISPHLHNMILIIRTDTPEQIPLQHKLDWQ